MPIGLPARIYQKSKNYSTGFAGLLPYGPLAGQSSTSPRAAAPPSTSRSATRPRRRPRVGPGLGEGFDGGGNVAGGESERPRCCRTVASSGCPAPRRGAGGRARRRGRSGAIRAGPRPRTSAAGRVGVLVPGLGQQFGGFARVALHEAHEDPVRGIGGGGQRGGAASSLTSCGMRVFGLIRMPGNPPSGHSLVPALSLAIRTRSPGRPRTAAKCPGRPGCPGARRRRGPQSAAGRRGTSCPAACRPACPASGPGGS